MICKGKKKTNHSLSLSLPPLTLFFLPSSSLERRLCGKFTLLRIMLNLTKPLHWFLLLKNWKKIGYHFFTLWVFPPELLDQLRSRWSGSSLWRYPKEDTGPKLKASFNQKKFLQLIHYLLAITLCFSYKLFKLQKLIFRLCKNMQIQLYDQEWEQSICVCILKAKKISEFYISIYNFFL